MLEPAGVYPVIFTAGGTLTGSFKRNIPVTFFSINFAESDLNL